MKNFIRTSVLSIGLVATSYGIAQTSTSSLNPSVTLGTVGKTSPYGPPPLTKLNPATLMQSQQLKEQEEAVKKAQEQQNAQQALQNQSMQTQ